MMVRGIVSNVSNFGAFVSIGLPEEGLVHVSELSDQFVQNPAEVVSVGQEVNARILSTDLKNNRISLSLRSPRPTGSPARGRGQKAKALRDLENLFKK